MRRFEAAAATATRETAPGGVALVPAVVFALVALLPFAAALPVELFLVGVGADLLVTIVLTAALLAFQRPGLRPALVCGALAAMPLAMSTGKFFALGQTAYPGDVLLVVDAARTLPIWSVVAAAVGLAGLAAIWVRDFRRPSLREAVLATVLPALGFAALVAVLVSPSAAQLAARAAPMQQFTLPVTGHWILAATKLVDDAQRAHLLAAASAVPAADAPVTIADMVVPEIEPRNVHIVVAESLVDPAIFTRYAFEPDPGTPLLRAWRARGGGDRLLVPVFGNRSSNTEFEILCGLPALTGPSALVFNWLERPLDCLPRLLAERGYRTEGRVPSHPNFFNAAVAYREMGFEVAQFDADFAGWADLDGAWLSAEATLAHARARIARRLASGEPFLDYTFVNAGHFPFERDESRRPDVTAATPEHAMLEAWANATHYSLIALETHLAHLRAVDPQAIVVVLGDHAPPLGADFAPYLESGLATNGLAAGPTGEPGMMQTPLWIFDAGRPVETGLLPAYLLPELILDLLSDRRLCARNVCASRADELLRAHREAPMTVDVRTGGVAACLPTDRSSRCVAARARTFAWDVLLVRTLAGEERHRRGSSDLTVHAHEALPPVSVSK